MKSSKLKLYSIFIVNSDINIQSIVHVLKYNEYKCNYFEKWCAVFISFRQFFAIIEKTVGKFVNKSSQN
jgi:hypothetical protein